MSDHDIYDYQIKIISVSIFASPKTPPYQRHSVH
nr:MAG TPA: hypothetical protein [Caudoviricetes sp.]